MKVNQLKLGTILSYAQMALGIIIGLVYTPIMIRILGQSEYGLYNTVSSTISVLSILNLGFNSGYVRYYAKYKNENDYDLIYRLNGLFVIVFSVIGMISLICGLFLSFNLEMVFSTGLTSEEYKTAFVLMILLTINLSTSFPMSVFSNIISANERFVFLKLIGMLNTIISPLVTLPLLLSGFRSIAMVSVSVVVSFVTNGIYIYYVLVVLKNKFVFRGFEKGLFKSLFAYTAFIAINLIIDQINWNIDKLLLGRFKGTAHVAIYSVGYALYSYYMSFSTSVSGVFIPRVHSIVNSTKNDLLLQRKQLTDIIIKVGRIQFLILGLIASGVVFFGKTFITVIWAGKEYSESYYVALLLIIPSSIALIQNVGIEIQRALNKHQFRSIVYAIMALINLILSIFLCQILGAVGSAIGTAFALVFANGLIMNVYYHKRCNIDIIAFWKNIIGMLKGLIIPVIVGYLLCNFCKTDKTWLFGAEVILYIIVYCISAWSFNMNENERNIIIVPINILKKKLFS